MSPVQSAIAAARLRELAGFLALPAEQLAHAMALVNADPMKLQAAVNIMTAEPGAEPIAVPRSWRNADARLWVALPPSIQRIIADREFSRDREVRRKQDECAELRHEVKRLQALLQPAADEQQQPTKEEETHGKEATERPEVRAQDQRAEVQPLAVQQG
jgi:hypothetical protein